MSEQEKKKDTLNCPEMVVRTRFNHVVKTINDEHGKDYAGKNPALVMHMMDQIRDERQLQYERN